MRKIAFQTQNSSNSPKYAKTISMYANIRYKTNSSQTQNALCISGKLKHYTQLPSLGYDI